MERKLLLKSRPANQMLLETSNEHLRQVSTRFGALLRIRKLKKISIEVNKCGLEDTQIKIKIVFPGKLS